MKATVKLNLNPSAKAEAVKMGQDKVSSLLLEFKNAVVQARSGQGSNYFGKPLKDVFRERGLTDAVMDKIIEEVNTQPLR